MLDYILNFFTSDDRYRPQYRTPFKIGENVYATDTYTLIKIPARMLSREYHVNEKAPKLPERILEGFTQLISTNTDINIESLATVLADVKWRYMRTLCPACNGTTEKVCEHCGNSSPCLACDGTGQSNDINFLIRKEDDYAAIKFNGHYYRPYILEKLLITLMALQGRKIEILQYEKKGQSLFVIGEIEVLLIQSLVD